MMDIEIIYLIRDELLTDSRVQADDIWSIAKIAEEDNILYNLMNSWMEQTDSTERDYLYHDMLYRRDQLLAKIIPFKRK